MAPFGFYNGKDSTVKFRVAFREYIDNSLGSLCLRKNLSFIYDKALRNNNLAKSKSTRIRCPSLASVR